MAFASPARDYDEKRLNIGLLVTHYSSTYYMKAKGDMPDAGISNGDILETDRSLDYRDGDLAICWVHDTFSLRWVRTQKDGVWLLADKDDNLPVKADENNFIWGIVTTAFKKFR